MTNRNKNKTSIIKILIMFVVTCFSVTLFKDKELVKNKTKKNKGN